MTRRQCVAGISGPNVLALCCLKLEFGCLNSTVVCLPWQDNWENSKARSLPIVSCVVKNSWSKMSSDISPELWMPGFNVELHNEPEVRKTAWALLTDKSVLTAQRCVLDEGPEFGFRNALDSSHLEDGYVSYVPKSSRANLRFDDPLATLSPTERFSWCKSWTQSPKSPSGRKRHDSTHDDTLCTFFLRPKGL